MVQATITSVILFSYFITVNKNDTDKEKETSIIPSKFIKK
jgi:hypothetical protein